MNCLIIMDPYIRIPPQHYGGIERVIADVAEVLARRGHQLTLWAAPGSTINGRVESFGREGEWTWWSNVRNMTRLAGRFVADASRFDVVHNFGRLAYLLPVLRTTLPKVQTYMRTVDSANMTKAQRLGAQRLHYTAVSGWVKSVGEPGGGEWSVVYNCAVPGRYPFVADTDPLTAPLVFLGRQGVAAGRTLIGNQHDEPSALLDEPAQRVEIRRGQSVRRAEEHRFERSERLACQTSGRPAGARGQPRRHPLFGRFDQFYSSNSRFGQIVAKLVF